MPDPPGLPEHRRPRRPLQPINFNALRPNEHQTEMEFINAIGATVTLPKGLVSSRWPTSCIPSCVAEALGLTIENLPPGEFRVHRGPRNRLVSTRFVWIWWRAVHLANWPLYLMRVWVLESDRYGDLGTALIIGRDFIHNVIENGVSIPQYVPPTLQVNTGIVEEDMLLSRATLDEDMEARVGSWLEDTYSFQEN